MFKAHGEWEFHIDVPLIYIKIIGGINKEGVESFSQSLYQEVQQLPEKSLRHAVTNLTQFELATADSMALTKQYFLGLKSRGYQRIDYIGANIVAKTMLESIWCDIDMDVRFFPTVANYLEQNPTLTYAKNWL